MRYFIGNSCSHVVLRSAKTGHMHATTTAQLQSAVVPVIRRVDELMRKRAILLNAAYVEL